MEISEKDNYEFKRGQFKRNCKWCGDEFKPQRVTKEYCSDKCRAQYNVNKDAVIEKTLSKPIEEVKKESKQASGSIVQGLKGVVEDISTPMVNSKVGGSKKSVLENEISTTVLQLNSAINQYNELVPLKGVAILGGAIGALTTEADASFLKFLWQTGLGSVGGFAAQKLFNARIEQRRGELKTLIEKYRQKLNSLINRRSELVRQKILSYTEDKPKVNEQQPNVIESVPIGKSRKLISSSELIRMPFSTFDFKGRWRELLGSPSTNFHMVIHGVPGQGKSTFSLQLADYLAQNFGRVLYASSEEGHNKTMKDKCILNKMDNENLMIGDFRQPDEILTEVQPNQFHFIVIDSLNDLGMGIDKLKEFREFYSNSVLITICQSTKSGQIRGSQQIVHDCDIEIRVNRGMAVANKNRFGRIGFEFEIF